LSEREEALGKLDVKVKDIMTKSPLTVDAKSTIDVAARGMENCGCGCCLVESKGKIVGIITERDIVRRLAARGSQIKKTTVRSVMTSPIVVIDPESTVEQALRIMAENKIRRLPVVSDEGLVGIVTIADIAKALAEKSGYTDSLLNALARQSPAPKGVYA